MNAFLKIPDVAGELVAAVKKALAKAGYNGLVLGMWEAASEEVRKTEVERVTVEVGAITPQGEEYAEAPVTIYVQTGWQSDPKRKRLAAIAATVRKITSPALDLLGEEAEPPIKPEHFAVRGISDYTREPFDVIDGWNVCADRGTWYFSVNTQL